MADLTFEFRREVAPGRVAIPLGLALGFDPLDACLLLRLVGGLGLGRLLGGGLEQTGELACKPDQHAAFHEQHDCVKHHAVEIAAAGEDGGGQREIQDQVMQGDGNDPHQDGPEVAISEQAGQHREEIHVQVDLPGMPGCLKGENPDLTHDRDGDRQARRQAIARDAPGEGRSRGQHGHHRRGKHPVRAARGGDCDRKCDMRPEQDGQSPAGYRAQ